MWLMRASVDYDLFLWGRLLYVHTLRSCSSLGPSVCALHALRSCPSHMPIVHALRTCPSYMPIVHALRTCPLFMPFIFVLRSCPLYMPFVHAILWVLRSCPSFAPFVHDLGSCLSFVASIHSYCLRSSMLPNIALVSNSAHVNVSPMQVEVFSEHFKKAVWKPDKNLTLRDAKRTSWYQMP